MISQLLSLFWLTAALFTAPEPPAFKGGDKALFSFIMNNMIYPDYAKNNCLQGTIEVSFKVNKAGKIYDSEVSKGYGIDLDQEALRLVRLSSGRWIVPASHDTTVALTLPVNFSLSQFGCETRSKESIKQAIQAYKTRQDLTKVVTNFYEKKLQGVDVTAQEIEIENLKAQLGYTEKYVDRTYKEGLRKLKQGDHQGACESFYMVQHLGSTKADQQLKDCN